MTALQMTTAAAAVANGGYLMKPQIVRRVEDATGRVVKETRPVAVRRVLEPDTVDTLTEILKGVVRERHRGRAAIPGYVVAGKTGTAQKIDANGRYSMIDHVASFVGFVPASRPALVILVSLDTPRGPAQPGRRRGGAALRAHRRAGAAPPGHPAGRPGRGVLRASAAPRRAALRAAAAYRPASAPTAGGRGHDAGAGPACPTCAAAPRARRRSSPRAAG